jgi:hypothetical protein
MDQLAHLLTHHGPSRASRLADLLHTEFGIGAEAARKRLSRARPPVRSFPIPLLPKREAFFYLDSERNNERFWSSFQQSLRETESVYGAALDGLLARQGAVPIEEFPVISGAPSMQKKQVPAALVLKRLVDSGFLRTRHYSGVPYAGELVELGWDELGERDVEGLRMRQVVERVMLDGLREWARKNNLASYNAIAIRGDDHPRLVGPYKWDLTGPSYLLPLRGGKEGLEGQGFFVADAFAGVLTLDQTRYFIRKAMGLRAITKVGRVLPMLFAQDFTPEALTHGHRAGLVMSTPTTLYGARVGRAMTALIQTLNNAAAVVSNNPDRLAFLLENLTDIEGPAGNLRGTLFELVVAFLVRNEGSIDVGVIAQDGSTGKTAEIDVLLVKGKAECVAIECKGKGPGVKATLEEVEDWLRRIPIFRSHIRNMGGLNDPAIRFEFWTTGEIVPDALEKLEHEKRIRTKTPITWRDGAAVRAYSRSLKETAVTKAIDEHFFKHPLAEASHPERASVIK